MYRLGLVALLVLSNLTFAHSSNDVVGAYVLLSTDEVPHGYLECNGQGVSVYDYPELFAVIRGRYGGSFATQTFNVPDMRGLVPRGTDRSGTVDSEVRATGDVQQDAMQKIVGEIGNVRVKLNIDTFTSGAFTSEMGAYSADSSYGGMDTINFKLDSSLVTRTADETRVKNMAVMFVIRALPPSTVVNVTHLCDTHGGNCVQPSDITALSREMSAVNTEVSNISADISMLSNSFDRISTAISYQSADIAVVTNTVDALNSTMSDQMASIAMLSRHLSTMINISQLCAGQSGGNGSQSSDIEVLSRTVCGLSIVVSDQASHIDMLNRQTSATATELSVCDCNNNSTGSNSAVNSPLLYFVLSLVCSGILAVIISASVSRYLLYDRTANPFPTAPEIPVDLRDPYANPFPTALGTSVEATYKVSL